MTQYGQENLTPAKYAIYIRGLPRDATEVEVLEHFNSRYDLSKPEMHYPLWFGCFGRPKPKKVRRAPSKLDTNVSLYIFCALFFQL